MPDSDQINGSRDPDQRSLQSKNQFDLERIRRELPLSGVYYQTQCPSTNDWAKQMAGHQDTPTPSLFLTSDQTHGRGQRDRHWIARPGSLTFSLLLEPPGPCAEQQALIPLCVGVQVCDSVAAVAGVEHCQIKWPNDVYWQDKKLSGCLLETVAVPHPRMVLGCGINVNNPLLGGAVGGISLSEICRSPVSLTDLLLDLVQRLLPIRRHLEQTQQILDRYRQRNWLRQRRIRVRQGAREILGRVIDISPQGALIVATHAGDVEIQTGQVTVAD